MFLTEEQGGGHMVVYVQVFMKRFVCDLDLFLFHTGFPNVKTTGPLKPSCCYGQAFYFSLP